MADPNTKKSIRILLLGATGSGKSSTGNTILSASTCKYEYTSNNTYFDVGQGSDPCTDENGIITREVLGQQVTVVDTPGAFNTKEDYKQIQTEIRAAIENSEEDFDAIVLVTRMPSNSLDMTDEFIGVLEVITTLLGDHFWDNGVLLFTHGDNYEKIISQKKFQSCNYAEISFEEFIRKNSLSQKKYAIGRYAKKLNFAVVRFTNNVRRSTARKEMVMTLLEKISRLRGSGYGKTHLPREQKFVPTPQRKAHPVMEWYSAGRKDILLWCAFAATVLLLVKPICGAVVFAVLLLIEYIHNERHAKK